jgi:ABC-type branched-subunit amino acid transport system ATPase component
VEDRRLTDGEPLLRLAGVVIPACGMRPRREFTADVRAGEAVALLGPRGSGKTALLDVVCGLLRPAAGRVVFHGEDITGRPTPRIARAGIARTFQTPPALGGTAVGEAVLAAAVGRRLRGRPRAQAVETGLAIAGLAPAPCSLDGPLDPAARHLVALGRVAAAAPSLALLDEPLAGVSRDHLGPVVGALRRLRDLGITLVVTAHDAGPLRAVCSRALAIREGRIIEAEHGEPRV